MTLSCQESGYHYLELPDPAVVGARIAYRDSGGDGPPVILLHGFCAGSCTWEPLLPFLPAGFRYLRPDGIGFSDPAAAATTPGTSSYGQAELLERFIAGLDLENVTLVGHAMGGEIAMLAAALPEVNRRLARLVLLSPSGLQEKIPQYIEEIAATAPNATWLRFAGSDFIANLVLEYACADPARVAPEVRRSYAEMFAVPGRVATIIRTARLYRMPDHGLLRRGLARLRVPVLILWGEADAVMPPEEMRLYLDAIPGAVARSIPGCGHIPQQEYPEATAQLLEPFLRGGRPPAPAEPEAEERPARFPAPEEPGKRLKLRRLFDHWSFGSLLVMAILKILQFFRRLGVRAEESGWRKVTGVFLRNEYSKFMLASFRLAYVPPSEPPADAAAARMLLTGRLNEFLMRSDEMHWQVEPGLLSFGLKRTLFCDLMVARLDQAGHLVEIEPHFDPRHPDWLMLKPEQLDVALQEIISTYNRCRRHPARVRTREIARHLRRWARTGRGLTRGERRRMTLVIERIMSGAFLYCEVLPEDPEEMARRRLTIPDLKKFRHPGWGMLCVTARFTPDFREVDLWCQFNHVTADGAPMQEMLARLKNEWGAAGEIVYPAQTTPVTRPETIYCGDGIFRARTYVDFQGLMRLRRWLNKHYLIRMNGPASLAGILMWGMSRHAFFQNKKMLLPVDMPGRDDARELGILVIRPGIYHREESPLAGFINFQREMNRRLTGTRAGRSESHEFLELSSMLHPVFYHLMRWVGARPLHEIVGTVGISIIRDAEMFISPLTDFQINGFMALGSVEVPTANGGRAGAVSICGSRPQIRSYLEALSTLVGSFPELLRLPDGWDEEI